MNTTRKGLQYWVERVSDHEMPALAAVVRKLEQIVSDDISSLGQLGQVVLHDNALTTKILRVANSASYNAGRPPITTISRAAVVLGAKAIRNICLTAKLLENLLKQNNLSPSLYQHVLRVMAQSLHAAMQAKQMLAHRDDDLQEEVFIAALLHHLGESAFWSLGGTEIENLHQSLTDADDPDARVKNFLGTSFNKLSCGLARSWQLGDLLIKSLEQPELRSPAVNSIMLANRLAEVVATQGWDSEGVSALLPDLAAVMNVDKETAMTRVLACAEETKELAAYYGARELRTYLPTTAANSSASLPQVAEPRAALRPDEGLQLKVLRELTAMMSERMDINLVIHTALEGIHRGIGMDRTVAALLTPDRKGLKARFMLGEGNDLWGHGFQFKLDEGDFFTALLKSHGAIKVGSHEKASLPPALLEFSGGAELVMAPILVADRCIGALYADRSLRRQNIGAEDFSAFNHFAQQVNLCLSALRQRK